MRFTNRYMLLVLLLLLCCWCAGCGEDEGSLLPAHFPPSGHIPLCACCVVIAAASVAFGRDTLREVLLLLPLPCSSPCLVFLGCAHQRMPPSF